MDNRGLSRKVKDGFSGHLTSLNPVLPGGMRLFSSDNDEDLDCASVTLTKVWRKENMKPRKFGKFQGLVVAMLVLLAVSVAPVMASDANGQCSGESGNNVSGDPVFVELNGIDKNTVIEKALKNSDIEKMKIELTDKGFSANGSKAYTVDVPLKDGTVVNVQIATFSYSSPDGQELDLNYVQNQKTGESIVVLTRSSVCLTCVARLIGSGGGCTAFCVTAGVFTLGVGCIACLGLLGAWTACPCYHCACETTGQACDLAASCDW